MDGHSELDLPTRVRHLEIFRSVCENAQPEDLPESRYCFYDVDNDSLMAGFSRLPSMGTGWRVLAWAIELRRKLLERGIPTSFALNLLQCRHIIRWQTMRGFVNDPLRLYMPDEKFLEVGRVIRSHLAGDGLIITARMLALAKATKWPIVFSRFGKSDVESLLPDSGCAMENLSGELDALGPEKADWLRRGHVTVFGVRPSDGSLPTSVVQMESDQ